MNFGQRSAVTGCSGTAIAASGEDASPGQVWGWNQRKVDRYVGEETDRRGMFACASLRPRQMAANVARLPGTALAPRWLILRLNRL
jgi:hypothetical protein